RAGPSPRRGPGRRPRHAGRRAARRATDTSPGTPWTLQRTPGTTPVASRGDDADVSCARRTRAGEAAMATTIHHERDADLEALAGADVCVVGYGNQGRSWALNLRDSGVAVRVATRADDSR